MLSEKKVLRRTIQSSSTNALLEHLKSSKVELLKVLQPLKEPLMALPRIY